MCNPAAISPKLLEESQGMLLFVIPNGMAGEECPRGLSENLTQLPLLFLLTSPFIGKIKQE